MSPSGGSQDPEADPTANLSPACCHSGLALAELLAARLCHEVCGAAGTLIGAVELACTAPESAAEALAVAADTATVLVARLRLLRAAWAAEDGPLDMPGLRALCAGLPRRVSVDLAELREGLRFPAASARLMLNVLLMAAESLPMGGVVTVDEVGPRNLMIVPRGRNAAWPAGLAKWMADPATPWRALTSAAPRGLQAPLTALLAHAAGIRMSFALAARSEAAPPLLLRFPSPPAR